MVQQNEMVMFLLGVGGLIYILINRQRLRHVPASKILIAGFYLLLLGRILTILEGFLLGELLDFLEHMCNTCSAILVAVWCWNVFGKEGE